MIRRSLIAVAMLALLALPVESQLAPSLGDRVQITQLDGSVRSGELREYSAAGLRIFDDELDRELLIESEAVAGIARSLGRQGSMGKSVLATMGIGALVGLVVVGPLLPVCDNWAGIGCYGPASRGAMMASSAAVGLLLGIPVGFMVGGARRKEAWADAVMPEAHGGLFARALPLEPARGIRIGVSFGM